MNRRQVLTLATSIGLTGAVSGCGSDTPKTQQLRLGDTVAKDNPEIAAETYFGDTFADLTDDRYQVQVAPGGTIGDHPRMNEMLRTGDLPLAKSLFSYLAAFDRRLGVLSIPYVFPSQAELFTQLDGKMGAQIGTILDGYGIVVLGYFSTGVRDVYNTKRAIRVPADLKGLRIRVPQDPIAIAMMNSLGATPMPMAGNEIASALKQKLIDGAENNVIYYVTSGHVEYAKRWSATQHQYGVDALLASKKFVGSLKKADQDALHEAAAAAVTRERSLWQVQTATFASKAKALGCVSNDNVDLAAFRRAVRPVLANNRGSFGDLANYLPA